MYIIRKRKEMSKKRSYSMFSSIRFSSSGISLNLVDFEIAGILETWFELENLGLSIKGSSYWLIKK